MPQEAHEVLERVQSNGKHLLGLINDVLDLSKIEAGRLEIETIAFDLPGLLVGCHRTFSVLAAEKGLNCTLTLAPEAHGLYQGDPLRLRQVIGNLLSNAVKFTADGTIDLSARLNGDALEIAVSDTGVGVAPNDLGRLFDKFSQHPSPRRYGPGPGDLPGPVRPDGRRHRGFQHPRPRLDLHRAPARRSPQSFARPGGGRYG
jgi:signal transduction histidine kinase